MRKLIICAGVMGLSMMLAGCENSFDHMPDMTEKEAAVIEEYAAGLILSRSDANRRLATVEEITYYDEREALRNRAFGRNPSMEEPTEEEQSIEVVTDSEPSVTDPSGSEPSQPPALPAFSGIASFAGANDFSIDYKGSSVAASYPDSSEVSDPSSLFFAMDASEGNSLLILHFDAVNLSGDDAELDMIGSDVRFRITVNGEDTKGALTTMLLDDLSSFKGTVAPGDVQPLVLIREIPEGMSVNNISISLRKGDENVSATLE